MSSASDFPIEDCLKKANGLIARGWTILQKFTCAGCGQRLTMAEPNKFFKAGTCDKCDAVTDIEKQGCNFLAMSPGAREIMDRLKEDL